MTRTFLRAPAFSSLDELLDWSERHGIEEPTVMKGPDGQLRGSGEVAAQLRLPLATTEDKGGS